MGHEAPHQTLSRVIVTIVGILFGSVLGWATWATRMVSDHQEQIAVIHERTQREAQDVRDIKQMVESLLDRVPKGK